MNSLTTLLSLSVLTAAPAASNTNLARESLLRAVPEDPAIYFGAWDLDGVRSTGQSSAWYRFLQDEQMQKLFDTMTSFVQEAMEKEGDAPDLPFELSDVCDSLQGSVAGFMQVHTEDEVMVAGLLVDPGDERGAFEDLFDQVVEMISQDVEPVVEPYGSTELVQFEVDGSEGNITFIDSDGLMGVLLSNDADLLLESVQGAVDRFSGDDSSAGFSASTTLSEARSSSTGNRDFEILFDAAPLIDMMLAEENPSEEELQMMQTIGVTGLRWAYGTAGIGKGEAFDISFAMHIPPSSLISDFVDLIGPAPLDLLKLMPANSDSVSISRFDVHGLYQLVMGAVREFDEQAYSEANGMLQMIGAMNGIDIEQDVIGQFNGDFASFVTPMETVDTEVAMSGMFLGANPGGAVMIGLENGREFETFLMDLAANFGLDEMIETETFQGSDIHMVEMGMEGMGIHFTFTKGAFVYSMTPDPVRQVIRMQGQEDIPSAYDNEKLRKLAGSLSGVASFSMANTRATVEMTLTVLSGMSDMMGMAGVGDMGDNPLSYMPWPDASIAEKYFDGDIVSTVHRVGSTLRMHTWSK